MIDTYLIAQCHNLENHNFNIAVRTSVLAVKRLLRFAFAECAHLIENLATAVYHGAEPVV